MIALRLAAVILELSMSGDMSHVASDDLMERFESLRAYGKLPRGRERRNQQLAYGEIAAALLGLVSPAPKWAGHTATVLCNLRTVGGQSASFHETSTLREAVERILVDGSVRKNFLRLSVSGAEFSPNSHGWAVLVHEVDGDRRHVSYVPGEAASQLQLGMQGAFDFDYRHAPLSRELTFNRRFFDRIARAIELTNSDAAAAESDGLEYETEETHEARFRGLGVRPGSRFMNVGVDNQVTWPGTEAVVHFDRYTLVLMPKTRDNAPSIHIDLTENKVTGREAMTVINRFLSIMTWCDDQFAIAQDGWSGNPVPVAVPRRDLAFTTAHEWTFNRKIPTDENAQRALAIYREARNAQQNYMVSYAVLNFYKVVEIGHRSRGAVKKWFRETFEHLRRQTAYSQDFEHFVRLCKGEQPHEYIYRACRLAVAHAGKDSTSDPDDADELVRLHSAADILRTLARHFIESEFSISDLKYSED